MLKTIESTNGGFLTMSVKEQCLKFNGEKVPGTVAATIKEIHHTFDEGSKKDKIKAGERVIFTMEAEGTDGEKKVFKFDATPRTFPGKKFFAALGNLKTPFISIQTKPEGDEHLTVFTGQREEETATKTTWLKFAYTIDWAGGYLKDADGGEVSAGEICEKLAELIDVPFCSDYMQLKEAFEESNAEEQKTAAKKKK